MTENAQEINQPDQKENSSQQNEQLPLQTLHPLPPKQPNHDISVSLPPGKSETNESSENSESKKDNWCFILLFHSFLLIGKGMRIYFQICEIYFCIMILCFLVNFELVLFYYQNDTIGETVIKLICLLGIYSFFTNPLTMTFWEFAGMHWVDENPYVSIGKIWNIPDKKFIGSYWVDWFMFAFFVLYILFALVYTAKGYEVLDYYHFIILFFPCCIKYLMLYLTYIAMSIYSFVYFDYPKDNFVRRFYSHLFKLKEAEENETVELQDPFVISMFRKTRILVKKKPEEFFESPKFLGINGEIFYLVLKICFCLVFLLYLIIDFSKFKPNYKGPLLGIILFLVFSLYTFSISMPFWFPFIFSKGYGCCLCCKGKVEGKVITGSNESFSQTKAIQKIKHFRAFMYINTTLYFLGLIIVIVLLFFLVNYHEKPLANFGKGNSWDGNTFTNQSPSEKKEKTHSPFCTKSISDLSLLQIGGVTYFASFETIINSTEVNPSKTEYILMNSFFREAKNITLSYFDFIANKGDEPVILKVKFDFPEPRKGLTIYSIRSSRTGSDWKADFELFVSSALFSVMRLIPLIPSQESICARAFTRIMTFPIDAFFSSSSSYIYGKKMIEKIKKDILENNEEEREIIVSGHSLGGGLSKIVGVALGIQSIAFSGPGITPIEYLFRGDEIGRYYKATYVDIIPDKDIVPRLEVSGGITYRLLCPFGVFRCHKLMVSLCMMGIVCEDEYYTEDFCRGYFTEKEYNKIKKKANSI